MMETGRKTIRVRGESDSRFLSPPPGSLGLYGWAEWADGWAYKAEQDREMVSCARRALNAVVDEVLENADMCGTVALCAAWDALLRIEASEEWLSEIDALVTQSCRS